MTAPSSKPRDASSKNIHSGHRERLRHSFAVGGLDPFSEVTTLEFLLFYVIPRQDTNPIAHRLLDTFGSLPGVFDASLEDLQHVGGLTENAATLIKLIPALARRYQISRSSMTDILNSTQKCGDYIAPYFLMATEEMVYLLALDAKCKVLGCIRLSCGSINSTALDIRAVVEQSLRMKASSVVIAHNHTSGIAVPSQEDIRSTRLLAQALDSVDVLLADHIIVADGDYVSLAESGLLPRPSPSSC